MNPTIRSVSNPIVFRHTVDLIAFIRVPNRFAAPIHHLCAPPKKAISSLTLSVALFWCPYDPDFSEHQTFFDSTLFHFVAVVFQVPYGRLFPAATRMFDGGVVCLRIYLE